MFILLVYLSIYFLYEKACFVISIIIFNVTTKTKLPKTFDLIVDISVVFSVSVVCCTCLNRAQVFSGPCYDQNSVVGHV